MKNVVYPEDVIEFTEVKNMTESMGFELKVHENFFELLSGGKRAATCGALNEVRFFLLGWQEAKKGAK